MAYPEIINGCGPVVTRLADTLRDEDLTVIDVTHIENEDDIIHARRLLETSGVRVLFSAAPAMAFSGLSLSAIDDEERRQAVDLGKRLLDEALDLGAELIFFISGPDPGPAYRAAATETLFDSLSTICTYASQLSDQDQMIVALEPADREIHHRQLLGPFAEAANLARELRRDHGNFSLVADLSHIHQLGEDPETVMNLYATYIGHIHLSNVLLNDKTHPLYGDHHPRFGVPGSSVDIRELAKFIQAVLRNVVHGKEWGRPTMGLEVKPAQGEDPDLVLASAKRAFFEAWAILGKTGQIEER